MEDLKTHPFEFKRQTGRSHRMLEEAVEAARKGKAVVVLFKDEMEARFWREKVGVVTGLSIESMKVKMPELDWSQMKLTGARGNHVLFIDHDVIFCYHKDLFKAWAKYDRPLDHSPYTPANEKKVA